MAEHLKPFESVSASGRSDVERLDAWLEGQPDDLGPGLPSLPDGRLPEPEDLRRRLLIRSIAIAALVVSAAYLTWRAFWTLDMGVWFVAIPLLLLEVHSAAGLGLFTFSLWDVDPISGGQQAGKAEAKLAMLIPTYDESVEVLLPVISAALIIEPKHETWVLDDGDRPEIKRLAVGLGARYLAREENAHAKAGNINNALVHIDAEIVGIVDADHVVSKDFFKHTLGYFEDPRVAVVQTPQDFYNVDSFEHEERGGERRAFNEQSVFYRLILPAKNRWQAAFWCGTGAVLRTAALLDVGGVATESVTEDIHTSIRMQKRGWKILAHNEVLARGLAASTADQFMLQRRRWARGAMQVLRTEKLIGSRRLTLAQRLAYSSTLFGWFDSLRLLLYVLLPIVVLATGALPIIAPLHVFAPMFLGTILLQQTALVLLARGHYVPWLSMVFEVVRMPAVLPALAELVKSTDARFRVTPKGRLGDTRARVKSPPLIVALLALSIAAFVWSVLTLAGLTPLTYSVPGGMYAATLFLFGNFALLVAATRKIMAPRHAGERRASVRFPVSMLATVDGAAAVVEEVSLTGVRLRVFGRRELPPWVEQSRREFAERETVVLDFPRQNLHLKAQIVRSKGDEWSGVELSLEFVEGQWSTIRDLALVLFHGDSARTSPETLDLLSEADESNLAEAG